MSKGRLHKSYLSAADEPLAVTGMAESPRNQEPPSPRLGSGLARQPVGDLDEPIESLQERLAGVRYCFHSGSTYSGEWNGTLRHGFGCQRWHDGAEYRGEWKENAANGRGEFRHRNGDVYAGEWVRNAAHGHGRYRRSFAGPAGPSTAQYGYTGQFQNDVQHGCGRETWPDGSSFEGQYRQGEKAGYGVYTWPDGSRYEGCWLASQISGAGYYTGCDGRTFRGQWQRSEMDGYGEYLWPDGRCYHGQYHADNKHGFGAFLWPDGRRFEGFWQHGMQHGAGRLHTAKGWVGVGEWASGRHVGWSRQESPPETTFVVTLRSNGRSSTGGGVAVVCTDLNGDCIVELETALSQTVGQVRAELSEKLVNSTLSVESDNVTNFTDMEERSSQTSSKNAEDRCSQTSSKNASTATCHASIGGRLFRTELILEGGQILYERDDHTPIADVFFRISKGASDFYNKRRDIKQAFQRLRASSRSLCGRIKLSDRS